MIEELLDLLIRTINQTDENFSGMGLIVWDEKRPLPIFPLRTTSGIGENLSTEDNLLEISKLQSDFHDGFHILTCDLKLIRAAQYFSPPIVQDAVIDRGRKFGGRYLAALFGSALAGVELTAIATPSSGIAIFKNGQEIYFKGY